MLHTNAQGGATLTCSTRPRVLAFALSIVAGAAMPAWAQGTTERVSVSSSGDQGNMDTDEGMVSADGRFVAFYSKATNLVPGDTNGVTDAFIRDRQMGTTERVCVSSRGGQCNGYTDTPTVSADGRFIAFVSGATNLVPGDTNGVQDIFVRDRQIGTTERVSVGPGRKQGKSASVWPAISADGRFVAFTSWATELVPKDSNNSADIFVRDRQLGTTQRVSVSSGGNQGNDLSYSKPAISTDGRFVAFNSIATNLVPGDTNGVQDIFVRDRQMGITRRVSVSSNGSQSDNLSDSPTLSADGRFVAFLSDATNLVLDDTNGVRDVLVHDLQTGATQRVCVSSGGGQCNGYSANPGISADGRFIVFQSSATNLVSHVISNMGDIFVRDFQTSTTQQINVSSDASQANGYNYNPRISADGRFVAFMSEATNLVPDDTNGARDVFVRSLAP